ncbi:hypothetical protein [Caulobacter sp. 17J65-9]|uniref:hypothetical protein n=1 Tax=Caulobacter sp. 17J65-9 TaxID=2709382 RepID=UPI0013CD4690|nr:hypothetical protein [Caulobacter sp. 17J65-9]NEX94809.1 hypothetical protein [Caulobacter sp. 17J65-9]
MRASTGYRLAAVAAIGLWVVAIALPVYSVDLDYASAHYDGREVLVLGALGVFAGTFAWWANLPWAWTTIRMLLGKPPGPVLTLISSLLAVSALAPMELPGANEAVSGEAVPQIGAFVWVAAFVPAALVALLRRRARPKRPSAAPEPAFVTDGERPHDPVRVLESIVGGFITDGQRTYDPVRGLELKVTGFDKEQLTSFQLQTPDGPIGFSGYPDHIREGHPDYMAPAGLPHIRWQLHQPGARSGDTRTKEELLALAVEALTAYGPGHGCYPAYVEVTWPGYSSRPSPASSS